MMKRCMVCETEFDARGSVITCGPECHRIRTRAIKKIEKAKYKAKYPQKILAEKARYRDKRRAAAIAENPLAANRAALRESAIRAALAPKIRYCTVCDAPFVAQCNVKTCSDLCWKMRYSEVRHRKSLTVIEPSARLAAKKDYAARRIAEASAALKLIHEIQSKGMEALL